MAFGDGILLFRVCNKIFACMTLDGSDYFALKCDPDYFALKCDPDYFALKCDPDYAIELRDRYHEIQPAYHWNKRHWNQLPLHGTLPTPLIQSLIRHSYTQVAKNSPKNSSPSTPPSPPSPRRSREAAGLLETLHEAPIARNVGSIINCYIGTSKM